MSKLAEYLKLLPKGLSNIGEIANGIKNQAKIELGLIDEDDLDIITTRRLICNQCPFNSKNAIAAQLYVSDREDEHCIQCGCPIKIKTASLDTNCGLEEYNNKHPNNPVPLKWTRVGNKTKEENEN